MIAEIKILRDPKGRRFALYRIKGSTSLIWRGLQVTKALLALHVGHLHINGMRLDAVKGDE